MQKKPRARRSPPRSKAEIQRYAPEARVTKRKSPSRKRRSSSTVTLRLGRARMKASGRAANRIAAGIGVGIGLGVCYYAFRR